MEDAYAYEEKTTAALEDSLRASITRAEKQAMELAELVNLLSNELAMVLLPESGDVPASAQLDAIPPQRSEAVETLDNLAGRLRRISQNVADIRARLRV